VFGCVAPSDIHDVTELRIDLNQMLIGLYVLELKHGDKILYHQEICDTEYFKNRMAEIVDKIVKQEPIEM
jgi:hypothetical protein